MEAGRKELDNLTNTGTVEPISPERKEQIKVEARKKGLKYVELPAKGVFTIKPDKFKVRIVVCGNKTAETYGKVSTTDLDTAMMRYLLSWGASSSSHAVASLDVTAAFLNAPLSPGRVVVMKSPTILYKLQLFPPGHAWLVHKAIYGLREAPNLWSEERTHAMTQVTFTAEGAPYSVILSEIHKSLCLIVKTKNLLKKLETTSFGLTPKVKAEHVVAMSGIYVDDYLAVGPPGVVDAFTRTLRKLWKTSEPQYLSFTQNLTFLGVTIEKKEEGLLLHQRNYTENLLKEHAAHLPARKRTASGDPEHFKKVAPPPPDPSNPEHQEWIKRGQRILGGVLWLSTRARSDLAYAISGTAQVLTKDLELLKVKLRHLTESTIYFGDSSFAPSGKHSQSGFTIHLSYGNARHLIRWQSLREPKIAESSTEAELYALASARKSPGISDL